MFFKILSKDLKRKKSMNIILFIFMITASMLISSSVNMLYAVTNAMDYYLKQSNIADNIILTFNEKENDTKLEEWLSKNDQIEESKVEDLLVITVDKVKLPAQYKEFKDSNTLGLSKIPEDYNLIFNQDNQKFDLKEGEIALPVVVVEQYGLKIGDQITIKLGDIEKKLTLTHYVKDAVYGSGFMAVKRYFLSDKDFDEYSKNTDAKIHMWSINKNDRVSITDVDKAFSSTSINSIITLNSQLVRVSYVMDLILAAIMVIVSIFLILISFLILRFTIVFTIEEDYREIGIMKAIGLKNKGIKSIYMTKYFAIALLGGGIGFILSIPFANILLDSVSAHIIMKTSILNFVLSILSIIFIVLITIGFCYLCTRKVNKLSAIESIRQGSTGERFSNSRKLKLHKLLHIKTPYFLAFSDLLSGFRRFIVLMITFMAGTALIIIPTNIINTLDSEEMLSLFGLSKFDFYVGSSSYLYDNSQGTLEQLFNELDDIKKRAKDKGVEVDIHPELYITSKAYADNIKESKSIMCMQAPKYSTSNYTYLSGTAPKLENEIAITEVVGDYFGIGIGDTIHCKIGENDKEYIVTALFQSMSNLGYSMRFSENNKVDLKYSKGMLNIFGTIHNNKNKEEAIQILKDTLPELDIKINTEFLQSSIGSIVGQLDLIKKLILIIVVGINFLITSLLVRMLIAKEIAEVAILKSIGFKNKDIRKWQIGRITTILIISIILGTIFANITGKYFAAGVFRMMGGTQISLNVDPFQVYIMYPAFLIGATIIAVLTSLSQIRKTQVWEINNQE